jgi:hypothetical protein
MTADKELKPKHKRPEEHAQKQADLGQKKARLEKDKGSPNVRDGASVPWVRAREGRGSFGLECLRSPDLSEATDRVGGL